ncbi:ParA family protein [Janibacter sp. GXQ6167]|uniref:ParA family protein n=1 Tax=Janibacter sp. GXQ6167 TaxID=3240791 RepID=UPI0035252A55
MTTIAVCSWKGGVGKTSVVMGLASAARSRGVRTLIVDLDPQGDATFGLGVVGSDSGTLADVIDRPKRTVLSAAIRASEWSRDGAPVDVAIGGAGLMHDDRTDLGPRETTALRRVLAKVEADYDVVIVDCPPSMGGLTRIGLAAADRALIVTEPGVFAVNAAERALRAVASIREDDNPDLHLLGILVNRARGHLSEHRYRTEELASVFGSSVLAEQIPERTAIQRAQGSFTPIHDVKDRGAREVARIFDQILAEALPDDGKN